MLARRILLVLCLALSSLAAVPTGAAAEQAAGSESFTTTSVANPQAVSDFWTRARLEAAEPLPLRQVPQSELRNSEMPERGSPYAVDGLGGSGTGEGTFQALATRGPIPFTRTEVEDPSQEVVRTHGKIFGVASGDPFECSGTVVNSDNKSVVWTAAHCVYGAGAFFTNLMFIPGYEAGNEPFGRWPAQQMLVSNAWKANADPFADYAALVVAPDDSGALLADVVGARGIAFNQQPNQPMQALAYPAMPTRLFDGERLHRCASTGSWRLLPPLIAIGCDMKQGSSGGGWIIHDEYLWSVTSVGIAGIGPVQFGPYLGDDALALYNLARGGTSVFPQPPSHSPEPYQKHRMRISFGLRKHLIARGRIEAASGHAGCAYLGAVQVVKVKFDSQGNAVIARYFKVVFTRSDGSYRVRLPDRAGRYAAILYPGGYDLYNDCGQRISVIRRHRH